MTEEEKTASKIEALRNRRIDDHAAEQLGYQLRSPALHVLMVPPRSLHEDLNVNLSVGYLDDMEPDAYFKQGADLRTETSLSFEGQLAVETMGEKGKLVHAAQFFHSGAIEFLIPIERDKEGNVVTKFWSEALTLASKAATSIERISRETRFYFVATLVGTADFRTQVDGKRHVCTRPFYRFPVIDVADHRALHSEPIRAVATRIAHTLGRRHL